MTDIQHATDAQLAIAAVKGHISTHLDDALPVMKLAAIAGFSPFHFARLFKALVGVSPHCYITRLRVERARLLLVATEIPLREVALGVGYPSQPHFNSVFRTRTGTTPGAYRKSARA